MQHLARITQGFGVQVRQVEENKGRGVVATKEYKEGDRIFSELPIALARSMKSHFPVDSDPRQVCFIYYYYYRYVYVFSEDEGKEK